VRPSAPEPRAEDPGASLTPPEWLNGRGATVKTNMGEFPRTSLGYAKYLQQRAMIAKAGGLDDKALNDHADKILGAHTKAAEQTRQSELEVRADELKKAGTQMDKLAEAGLDARGHQAMLETVRELGRKAPYGIIPKIQSELGKYGIETKGLSDIQAYERAIDYMAPQLRPIGSGRLMQQELTAFKSSLGGLMTTPEGREISVSNLGLLSQYQEQIGKIASNTDIPVNERMRQIYSLPPPKLKTLADLPPGVSREPPKQPQGAPAPGNYKWNPSSGKLESVDAR
jgi:hypothetical protein